jgi:hypothetical protein
LNEFFTIQKSEWLSSSDILGEARDGLNIQEIDQLDSISEKILFSADGVFNGLEISPQAQDNISVALTLSIIDMLWKLDPITAEKLTEIKSWEWDFFNNIKDRLEGIRSAVWITDWADDGLRGSSVDIAGKWEGNYIFMQTEKWKEFFDRVLSGTLASGGIKAFIESQNIGLSEEIKNNLKDLGISGRKSIFVLKEKIGALKLVPANSTRIPKWADKTQIERLIEKWGFSAMIAEFLKTIIELMKWFTDWISWNWDDIWDAENQPRKPVNPEDAALTPIQTTKKTILDTIGNGVLKGIDRASIKSLLWNDENIQNIMRIVDEVPSKWDEDTATEKLINILKWTTKAWDFKINEFITTNKLWPIKNDDNTLNTINLMTALWAYKTYRITKLTHPTLNYEEYYINNNE